MEAPSSRLWLSSPKVLAALAGGAIVLGGIIYYMNTKKIVTKKKSSSGSKPLLSPGESYEKLLEDLKSQVIEKQLEALDRIYQLTRHPQTHDNLRVNGGLARLLEMFAQRKLDDALLQRLTRVIANLATNDNNRLIIGESDCISDMLYYLDNVVDEVIVGDILRGLMNLSCAEANEDKIREKGGVTQLAALLSDMQTSEANLLQLLRVLVNLACNEVNRKVMLDKCIHTQVVKMLFKYRENNEFALRLVRLAGSLAYDAPPSILQQFASEDVAELLCETLIRETRAQKPDVSLCEVVMYALVKIATVENKEGSEYMDIVSAFKAEVSRLGGVGPIMDLLCSEDRYTKTAALYCVVHLSQGSSDVKAKLRAHSSGMEELERLSKAKDPGARKLTTKLLQDIMLTDELD